MSIANLNRRKRLYFHDGACCLLCTQPEKFRHSELDSESWNFLVHFVSLSLVALLFAMLLAINANARTYNENSTFPLMRARLSLSLVALLGAKKKSQLLFCDLNNNLGRRFWDSLYMHDMTSMSNLLHFYYKF